MADASGNNANYYTAPYAWPIDSGKYTTVAGEFQNSDSPYGTFDQGGNVWEWNEEISGVSRGQRGGSWIDSGDYLAASFANVTIPSPTNSTIGFRVATLAPEPGTGVSGLVAMLGLLRRRTRSAR
jgi:formylglycine-generating enzyme required for sulfatase activity